MDREAAKRALADALSGGMTCKACVETVTDYLEGALSLSQWLRFQSHLGLCLGCRRYLGHMKQTVQALGHLPQEPVPIAIRDELLERFRTWKERPSSLS